MRVERIEGVKATVEAAGVCRSADVRLLEDVKVGDYVLVHVGFAIEKIDPKEAQETLDLLDL